MFFWDDIRCKRLLLNVIQQNHHQKTNSSNFWNNILNQFDYFQASNFVSDDFQNLLTNLYFLSHFSVSWKYFENERTAPLNYLSNVDTIKNIRFQFHIPNDYMQFTYLYWACQEKLILLFIIFYRKWQKTDHDKLRFLCVACNSRRRNRHSKFKTCYWITSSNFLKLKVFVNSIEMSFLREALTEVLGLGEVSKNGLLTGSYS